MKHRAALYALITVLLLGLVLAGCSSPSIPRRERQVVGDGLLPRTSPENVLFNLRLLYGEKDGLVNTVEDAHYWAEKYRELLHPDYSVFKFYFIPGDAPPAFPDGWWGIDDEVVAFECLLEAVSSGLVERISLDWTLHPAEPDNRVDPETGEFLHSDWKRIHVTSILLDIVIGENTYRIPNGLTDFYFAPDPVDSTLWVVTEWRDGDAWGRADVPGIAGKHMAGVGISWGELKGLFKCR